MAYCFLSRGWPRIKSSNVIVPSLLSLFELVSRKSHHLADISMAHYPFIMNNKLNKLLFAVFSSRYTRNEQT